MTARVIVIEAEELARCIREFNGQAPDCRSCRARGTHYDWCPWPVAMPDLADRLVASLPSSTPVGWCQETGTPELSRPFSRNEPTKLSVAFGWFPVFRLPERAQPAKSERDER